MTAGKKNNKENDGKNLPLVEHFFSIQGEGYHSGKPAYFIRLGGCDIGCRWCDSPYTWNPDVHPIVPVDEILNFITNSGTDSVVVTGGEPLMWNLDYLCNKLKEKNLVTFLETSGAYKLTGVWDWICLSPKISRKPDEKIWQIADELKIIVGDVNDFRWAEECRLKVKSDCVLYLQPEWKRFKTIIPEIVEYVKQNRQWRISLQIHKYMNIP